MNKPASPTDFRTQTPDYHRDGYGWAMHQAALIRAGEREHLDWENIAEEIESVGKSEYRAAQSALRIVLVHQLKWEYQPMLRSRSWVNSIRTHLDQFDDEIADNPSLKPHLDEILLRAYKRARNEAAQETGLLPETFPDHPPTWDAIRGPLAP